MNISIEYFPEEWGIYIPYSGEIIQPLRDGDLETLAWLRKQAMEYYGEPVPHKLMIVPLSARRPGLIGAIRRLWQNGIVSRFATTFHTLSGRPNYNSWYIWDEECNGQQGKSGAPRRNNRAPFYYVPKRSRSGET